MINISSIDNNKIKSVCRLYDRKFRRRDGRYITEGYRNVKDSLPYLQNPELFISESAYAKYGDEFPTDVLCADKVFAKISGTDNSQGVLCVSDIPENRLDFCANSVFLDGISDPGNLGTILRSCLATDFNNIIISGGVDCYNPKVVRSAMSALCKLNVFECESAHILQDLSANGYKILCADMRGKNLYETDFSGDKICLVIGSEAHGVSGEAVGLSDEIISLPMGKIESLNAAVCASVIMYRLRYNQTKIGG